MSSTIVAIATASGISSISIVRVSGKDALNIAKKITKRDSFKAREVYLASLYNREKTLIDQAIVIYFKSPKSFTGEDIIEFQCHGGFIIAQEILETAISYGCRLAEAGEFTKRAFLNGKIDLTKAEAIAKLIETKSVNGAKILAKQLKGDLKSFIEKSRDKLLRAIAYSEVMIDYAEEDIPDNILESIVSQLDGLIMQIEKILDASYRRKGIIEGFRVAIIGKPNVGKSSLLNAFLSYDRAIVSSVAGTTRDTIEEQVRIGSHIIRLIDTAGIRDATNIIEKMGVERSIASIKDADVIIALFDRSLPYNQEDEKIINILKENSHKEVVVVLNKSDLRSRFNIEKLSEYTPIEISVVENFKPLVDRLEKIFNNIGSDEELMLISTRQIDAVKRSRNAILEAKEPLLKGELEFFSYHLQDAVAYLSSISRPYSSEEILDKMFGEFCLGK
jgi:tRNA modification GTPase